MAAFYDLSVGTYLQIVGASSAVLKKGAEYLTEQNLEDAVNLRLTEDMANFHFQAVCIVHHSLGAIKGIQEGVFKPPAGYPDTDYAGLQNLIDSALAELGALDEEAINALATKQMVFSIGDNQIPFTAENFVLSFSLPNLYFHATTAYDILRIQGVPLGKMDFLGQLKIG